MQRERGLRSLTLRKHQEWVCRVLLMLLQRPLPRPSMTIVVMRLELQRSRTPHGHDMIAWLTFMARVLGCN